MDHNYSLEGETEIDCWKWEDGTLKPAKIPIMEPVTWLWEALNQYSYVSFAQCGQGVKTYLFGCYYKPEPANYLALSVVLPNGRGFDPEVYACFEIVLLPSWPDVLSYTAYLGTPIALWEPSDHEWDGDEGRGTTQTS